MLLTWIGAALIAAVELPMGPAPAPVALPHFPSRLHAFVWRNWQVVPVDRMAEAVKARPDEIIELGKRMGLSLPPPISEDQWQRSFLTIIRRNWHLLPYDQLLVLLDWTPEKLAFTLREDDFFFIKLGLLKPACEPLWYAPPDEAARAREREIASIAHEFFPNGPEKLEEPLFDFVRDLSAQTEGEGKVGETKSSISPRYCYSYFALYGDPLSETALDPYPEAYLARLAASGVDGIWLQAVLFQLAEFPWDPTLSVGREKRLAQLNVLIEKAARHGIKVYLYLNEPRAMPLSFFDQHPDLKGSVEGDHAVLCTSHPTVREYLTGAVATICQAAPDLGGFFTITASENLSSCFSHYGEAGCPRCVKRTPGEGIAGLLADYQEGIRRAGTRARLIAWDWGWKDEWALDLIAHLPQEVALMSVSEWSIPIQRGGIDGMIGEYSISTIGPGPRAKKHWEAARKRGLNIFAKIQAGVTWEIGSVPYIPAVANVAQHISNLRDVHVDGLMLGWTLGGYPSPNLEVAAEMGARDEVSPEEALNAVAVRRYGEAAAPAVVKFWKTFSTVFQEFPFDGSLVYNAPQHMGPANLLWGEPTGYRATMVGLPYDDLTTWRGGYPEEVFIGQFQKMADGFETALAELQEQVKAASLHEKHHANLEGEMRITEAILLHYRSVSLQARFVVARNALATAGSRAEAVPLLQRIEEILRKEIAVAVRLHAIQRRDSRIGFEATNQYYYLPLDLSEKVLNCRDLLDRWLPEQQAKFKE